METIQTTPEPLASGVTPQPEEMLTQIEQMRGDMSATIGEIPAHRQLSDLAELAVNPATSAAQDATSGAVDTVAETAHTATNTMVDAVTHLLDMLRSSPALMAALPGLIATLLASGRSTAARAEETVEQAGEQTRTVAIDAAMALWKSIQQNPALKGALVSGATWALAQGTNAIATAGQARQGLKDAADQASETVTGLAGQGRETAGHLGAQAQQEAQRAAGWLQHMVEQNPLVVALAVVVIGAAIGLSSEPTQLEHRVMGPTRDRLLEQVQTMATELMGQARTQPPTNAG